MHNDKGIWLESQYLEKDKPHQRHQFSVLIDGAIPAMQLAALLQLV
jgi:hypothetical protein